MARPAYLVGRNVTLTIDVGTDDGAGTLTFAGPVTCAGKARSIREMREMELERVEPLDAKRANNVPILTNFSLAIEGLQFHSKTSGSNPLEDAFMLGYDSTSAVFLDAYVKVIITKGSTIGSTTGYIWTYIGVIQNFESTIERGVPTHRLTVAAIDNGATNPALT